MAYTPKPNSGALFKNNRKEKENQPDYTGDAFVGGVEFRVSAWLKKSNAGQTFMSLAYTPKDEQQNTRQQPVMDQRGWGGQGGGPAFDDEIPFAPVRW